MTTRLPPPVLLRPPCRPSLNTPRTCICCSLCVECFFFYLHVAIFHPADLCSPVISSEGPPQTLVCNSDSLYVTFHSLSLRSFLNQQVSRSEMKPLICLFVCSLSLFLEGKLCESRDSREPIKCLLGGITFISVSTHSKCLVDVCSVESLGLQALILRLQGWYRPLSALGAEAM